MAKSIVSRRPRPALKPPDAKPPAHRSRITVNPGAPFADEAAFRKHQATWPAEVWRCLAEASGAETGYLVSEKSDVNKIVAYVPFTEETQDKAFELAMQVAECPGDAGMIHYELVWDLHRFARPRSTEPTPEFLYRLNVARIGEPDGFALRLWPFCRFRLAHLLNQFAGMAFPDVDRAAFPNVTVYLADGGEAQAA